MRISDISIDRPVFISMCAAATMVMGFLALSRLGIDLFPEVAFPIVAVQTVYPGASPEEVEKQITKPIEEAVATVNGVDKVKSFSRESSSVVLVVFKLSTNIQNAASDVRDRIQQVRRQLPSGIEDPIITKQDPSAQPILTLSVRAPMTSAEIRKIVDDKLRPLLESVEGVGSVEIKGGAEREVRVEVDKAKIEALGLPLFSIAQSLKNESFDLPGGLITESGREYNVKAAARIQNPEELGNVVLRSQMDGTQIRLRDVATIKDTIEEMRSYTRVDGQDAVTVDIRKQSGTNTVAVIDRVQEQVKKIQTQLGAEFEFTTMNDQSKFIRNNINRLREHLILGGLLAILVIFIFMLDIRSTLISAVALPMSVIATFFVMWQMDFSLNIMSMLGLTLSIGLLIDDSVVVRENIFRYLEQGEDPVSAARKGTAEIALAVLATTLTIVAVFIPIAFMGGIVGQFFKQFGLTIAAAVLVSLVVSFTLDPMLSARFAGKIDHERELRRQKHWFYGPMLRFYERMDLGYHGILEWALSNRKKVIALTASIFIFSVAILPRFMGTEFFTKGDAGQFEVAVDLAPGTALKTTDRIAAEVEKQMRNIPEVLNTVTEVGVQRNASRFAIRVIVSDKKARDRTLDELMDQARTMTKNLAGATVDIRLPDLSGNTQLAPISILVKGPDFEELNAYAKEVLKAVQNTPGTRDIGYSLKPGSPEQRFTINRQKIADLGVNYAVVAQTLRTALEGDVATTIPNAGDDIDVRVRLIEEDRNTMAKLASITVPGRAGQIVRLGDVLDVTEAASPAVIERDGRQRSITVSANLLGRSLGEVMKDIQTQVAKVPVKSGYTTFFEGEAERMQETFTNMLIALGLAIIFIYFILASQFESIAHPFTIMMALPLAAIGALGALFLTGLPIGMPSMIGIILLMGLVTKNGILLVDYANQVRRDTTMTPIEAMLRAGPVRLRPILMTSAAIVLGELPTAFSSGDGSEFNKPMAIAVIGGVITSTILTLVVVPIAYVWVDGLVQRFNKKKTSPS